MGYQMSKSKKKVVTGDEAAALEIIRTLPFKTQRLLRMNKGLGIQYDYQTLLHLAALRGMPNLSRVILTDFGGDPNWLEDNVETFTSAAFTRAKHLKIDSAEKHQISVILLEWRARMINQQGNEKKLTEEKNAIDTGLHLAAADGLIASVEELIKSGISPFMGHEQILAPKGEDDESSYYCTAFLIDKVMTLDREIRDEEKSNLRMREDDESCFSFNFNMISDLIDGNLEDMSTLRNIDKVLGKSNVKISSITGATVPLPEMYPWERTELDRFLNTRLQILNCYAFSFTEYYRERMSIKWTTDLIHCFKRAGITVSQSAASLRGRMTGNAAVIPSADERYVVCPICMLTVAARSRPCVQMKCGHNFCSPCWQTYLTGEIDNKCQISILCPIYNCKVVIPNRVVESIVSPDLVRKYRSLKLMALINSANFIKWCPVSDCGLAVRLSVPRFWKKVYEPLEQIGLVPSRAVECGNGHSFCWECLDICHAPMPCDQWQMWLKRVREHDPEAIPKKIKECAETVNHLWIADQSKVCPMCKAPTEENDGCKYMSCTQCEYLFRYICLGVCEIRPTLVGGLAECITPNDYSSVRGRHISSIRHEEGSDVDKAARSGNVICTRHKECSGTFPRQRGKYVLILHKEYSDLDEVLRGGYYTFNRSDDAYQMIDKLRQKYFVCTKNGELYDMDETEEKLLAEAIVKTQERRGLKKFNRYYLKYMEMLKALEREKYYFKIMCDRVERVQRALTLRKESPEKGKERVQFLINGMLEVLKMRETVVSSFAYAYYLDEMGFNTDVVCRQQREFEALIKTLMDMLVMPRTEASFEVPPRLDITNLTMTCRRTRYGFTRVVINSLYRQDLFAFIKREKKKYPNCNFGSQDEDNKESNHYPAVSSTGAENQLDTIPRRKIYKNSNHSWLDFNLDPEFAADETLPESEVRPRKLKGCKKSKKRNPGRQKGDNYCPKCKPKDSQRSAFYLTPWRRVEIREKIPQATAEGMENRIASCLSFATRIPQAAKATTLCKQQQKTDVGITIANVIQEADAEKSAHHSKTNGDQKDERGFDISFENDFQGVAKIAEDTWSRDTEEILGKEVDSFKTNPSENGSCTNPGRLEASFSTENSEEQLAGDPETNTHLDFHFEEVEEATERSPKLIEKPGYPKTNDKMSGNSTIPEFQFFRQKLPSRTIEGEATSNPLNYIKTEAKISFLTESGVFEEIIESKNNKIKVKQSEFKDASRCFEKEFVKPSSMKKLLDEASNTSKFFKQEGYFGDTGSCSHSSQLKPKANEFSRYCPEMMSTGKASDGGMTMLENQETDFRSATEFLKLKEEGPRPFPTRKEDFCAPQPVKSDYNPKKEYKKPSTSDIGEYLTKKHSLHTEDSSCEYESITGLPKSPNLCISGVFITRTPESGHISRKDAQMLQSSSSASGRYYSSPKVQEALEKYKATGRMFGHCGGSDRSCSLSDRGYDSNRLNAGLISTSHLDRNSCFSHRSVTPPRYSFSLKDDPKANRTPCNYDKIPGPPVKDPQMEITKETGKSKSSSEPEERRMFPLHKSPTEGALSSVLYVNENYSSEDDFHEVLFLLGRSQKDPAKRKKKKERERKMEFSYKEDRDDFSSAL